MAKLPTRLSSVSRALAKGFRSFPLTFTIYLLHHSIANKTFYHEGLLTLSHYLVTLYSSTTSSQGKLRDSGRAAGILNLVRIRILTRPKYPRLTRGTG
jgi:hypothetical protein